MFRRRKGLREERLAQIQEYLTPFLRSSWDDLWMTAAPPLQWP